MTALHADEPDRWPTVKSTVARALQDALRVVETGARRDGYISVPDYVEEMEQSGVTVLAAQDTLRFLHGTGAIEFTEYGDIRRTEVDVAEPTAG